MHSCLISIHSPLRGETTGATYYIGGQRISIHSPLRGETRESVLVQIVDRYFNPLASERRDKSKQEVRDLYAYFNPLASERRDKIVAVIHSVCVYFNPLASERRDSNLELVAYYIEISIHSPLRGET